MSSASGDASHPFIRGARWGALAALLSLLVWRVVFVLGLPGIAGADPYTRLYARDSVVVELFSRKWPPLLQILIKAICDAGGDLGHVRALVVGLSVAFIVAAAAYMWRAFGLGAALLAALWLAVDPDILWISIAPYQELLLYVPVCVVLLLLVRLPEALERGRGLYAIALLLPWLVIAEMARYEGVLWVIAVAVVCAEQLWRERRERRVWPYASLLAVVVIPVVDYLWFTGGAGLLHQRSPTQALAEGRVLDNLGHLARYLSSERGGLLLWPALAGLFVVCRDGGARRPDVRALHVYTLLFACVYVLATPYIPAANRRFHVPLLLTLVIHAAVAGARLAAWLWSTRRRAWCAAFALVIALQSWVTWRDAQRFADRRVREHFREYRIGRMVDERVARERPVLLAWERGDYHGYPAMRNMRIIAHIGGEVARVHFLEELRALPTDARGEFLARCGAVLIRRSKREPAARRAELDALLTELRAIHQERVHEARAASDVMLYWW